MVIEYGHLLMMTLIKIIYKYQNFKISCLSVFVRESLTGTRVLLMHFPGISIVLPAIPLGLRSLPPVVDGFHSHISSWQLAAACCRRQQLLVRFSDVLVMLPPGMNEKRGVP